ncbi:hypothetical protein HAX54_020037 [Datura stramonium]|uniref:Protein TIFY n=1 Tax=Datura stramonium TaxID=4076 RepID=A0ABS8USP8_DATST|nr:hypothetical protein [Datura stramonium]
MARIGLELDFFSKEKESSTDANLYPRAPKLESGITFGEIDRVISKTDSDEILKNAIYTLTKAKGKRLLDPSTPRGDYPLLPVYSPTSRLHRGSENGKKTAPLTIFYDGTVAVFDVSSDKAEDILKFAERSKIMDDFSSKKQLPVETSSGDVPLARRNSLLRFLEKRKERLTMASSPYYGFPQSPVYGNLGHTAPGNKY